MTETQPVDLTAFMAAAEYAILEAPHGSDHEASESLISAGCYYAPRLLAAVEAVLALASDMDEVATELDAAADRAELRVPAGRAHHLDGRACGHRDSARAIREAITLALLGEGE